MCIQLLPLGSFPGQLLLPLSLSVDLQFVPLKTHPLTNLCAEIIHLAWGSHYLGIFRGGGGGGGVGRWWICLPIELYLATGVMERT